MIGGVMRLKENLVIGFDGDKEVYLHSYENNLENELLTVRGSTDKALAFPTWVRDLSENDFIQCIKHYNKDLTLFDRTYLEREVRNNVQSLLQMDKIYTFYIHNGLNDNMIKEYKADGEFVSASEVQEELEKVDSFRNLLKSLFNDEETASTNLGMPRKARNADIWERRTSRNSLEENKNIYDYDMDELRQMYIDDQTDDITITKIIEVLALQDRMIKCLCKQLIIDKEDY